jgi:hypothetical protein
MAQRLNLHSLQFKTGYARDGTTGPGAQRFRPDLPEARRELIRRLVLIYSNPASIQPNIKVLDPFMGIGSTAVVALECGRNVVGFELKESYHQAALANVERERKARERRQRQQRDLFAAVAEEVPA